MFTTFMTSKHRQAGLLLLQHARVTRTNIAGLGPESTRKTYLTYLIPYLSLLEEASCPWNSPPEHLRPLLFEFHRDRLGCLIRPGQDGESIELVPTRKTLLRASTLRVLRAALRDFYLVLKDAGLYGHANPLSSEVLAVLKREHARTLANSGAPTLQVFAVRPGSSPSSRPH